MEELKNCPTCDSSNVHHEDLAFVDLGDCLDCNTEAPSKAWQGPRKRVEELEAQLKQESLCGDQLQEKCDNLRADRMEADEEKSLLRKALEAMTNSWSTGDFWEGVDGWSKADILDSVESEIKAALNQEGN